MNKFFSAFCHRFFVLFYAVVYSISLLSISGTINLAEAAQSCADYVPGQTFRYTDGLDLFMSRGGKTYAVAKGDSSLASMFFTASANILREYEYDGIDTGSLKSRTLKGFYGNGRPVNIVSQDFFDWLQKYYTSTTYYIDAWKEYDSQTFTQFNGGALTYESWATPPPPAFEKAPLAVAINNGKMEYGHTGEKIGQIWEFDGVWDCAIPSDISEYQATPGTGTGTGGATLGENLNPDQLICSADKNENGFVGEVGETATCKVSGQDAICPIDAQPCTALHEEPVCPSGTTLNPGRDMCQVDPQVTCPVNYVWDRTIDRCTLQVTCEDGGVLNKATDRCEKQVLNECPASYQYDQASDTCIKTPTCPDTGTYLPARDRCEAPLINVCDAGFSYNVASKRCEAPPQCPLPSATYNTTTDRCEQEPTGCPFGYQLNPVLDRCTQDAQCPTGGALNNTTDRCEAQHGTECESGWTYSASNQKCEKNPTCTGSGAYSSALDLCLVQAENMICPSDYHYDTVLATCIQTPTCPGGGTLDPVNDRCATTPEINCPDPSYTVNPNTNRCEKAPVCPSGYTYSAEHDQCLTDVTPLCPTGYNMNYTTNQCERVPECTGSGNSYNPTTNKCEKSGYCPTGYTWNGSACIYNYPATLTGGMVFDKAVSVCLAGIDGNLGASWCAGEVSGYVAQTPFSGSKFVSLCQFYTDGQYGYWCAGEVTGYVAQTPFSGGKFVSLCQFYYDQYNPMCWGEVTGYIASAPGTYGGTYTCPSGGTLSGTTCYLTASLVCDNGGTFVNGVCQSNPVCSGGSFDGDKDICYAPYTPVCTGNSTYDPALGKCIIAPTCSGGAFDAPENVCYQSYLTSCASGYTSNGSVCYAVPVCGQGGAFDGSIDYCSGAVQPVCPASYQYSSSYAKCYNNADCGSGSLDSVSDLCQMTYTMTCGTDYTLDGTVCVATPDCFVGGAYDNTNNVCQTSINCPTPLTYDGTNDICHVVSTCPTGSTLNIAFNVCEIAATPDCTYPSGQYIYDGANGVCALNHTECAPDGTYAAANLRCEVVVVKDCGLYDLVAGTGTCKKEIVCPTDTGYSLNNTIGYSTQLDICQSDTVHTCTVAGTTYISLPPTMCEAVPVCDGQGTYSPVTDDCVAPNNEVCPYGANFKCVELDEIMQCSPHECFNQGGVNNPNVENVPEPLSLIDDGVRDADGNCLGQMYIFGGKANRCRPPGWTVGYINNCCSGGETLPENTSTGIAAVGAISNIVDMAKAAQIAYQGFTYAQGAMALGDTAAQAAQRAFETSVMVAEISVQSGQQSASAAMAAADAFNQGAQGATSGASAASTVSSAAANAAKGLAGAAAVYAVGALVKALGGDQDAVAAAQIVATVGVALLTGPQALIGIVVIVVMRVLMGTGCDANDITTAMYKKSNRCHFVGTYCEKKIFGACAQEANGYCCFNSILARIIQEQGRPQLKSFSADLWGPPKQPHCRGFTPEEFQSLDFSKIDLSEYIGVVTADMSNKITNATNSIAGKVQQRAGQIQSGATP